MVEGLSNKLTFLKTAVEIISSDIFSITKHDNHRAKELIINYIYEESGLALLLGERSDW